MTVFFTSDTHFGDPRILRIDRRPFPDLPTHDAALVEAWNAVVGADDTVWHLGDFALGPPPERVASLLAALRGRKHLIIGNNDGPATLSALGWTSRSRAAGWCCATTPSGPGTAWAGARSTCTAIPTAGSNRSRANTMSASMRRARRRSPSPRSSSLVAAGKVSAWVPPQRRRGSRQADRSSRSRPKIRPRNGADPIEEFRNHPLSVAVQKTETDSDAWAAAVTTL